jgi:hypothetical protein
MEFLVLSFVVLLVSDVSGLYHIPLKARQTTTPSSAMRALLGLEESAPFHLPDKYGEHSCVILHRKLSIRLRL